MKLPVLQGILIILLLLLSANHAFAQLKVGDNPATINQASLLELESLRQGLLLPRIVDTTLAPLTSAPDGMIIYHTLSKSLLVRSNGYWTKLLDSIRITTKGWQITGNANTTSANYIGTSDSQALSLRTNGTEAINISTSQTVTLKQVPTSSSFISALVIDSNGSIKQRTLSTAAFSDAIRSLNSVSKQGFTIRADTLNAAYGVTTSSSDSTITMNVPIVNSTTQKTGLLTYSDWVTFNNKQKALTVASFLLSPTNANGLAIDSAAATIRLVAADVTNPGGVSTTTQSFAGFKTIRDTLAVGKNAIMGASTNPNSTLQVSGSMSLKIRTTSSSADTLAQTDNTLLVNAGSGSIVITLPTVSNIAGRFYTIKKIAGSIDNSVTIQPQGGVLIEGASSYVIYNNYTYVTIQTDGSNWYVIRK